MKIIFKSCFPNSFILLTIVSTEGFKESDIIKATIALNKDSQPEMVCQVLYNLCVCIKYGNCEIPKKHFK